MNFKSAEKQYQVLRKALQAGRISMDEYRALVKRIVVFDAQNRRWQMGPASGEWYRLEGTQWVKDTPPSQPQELPSKELPVVAEVDEAPAAGEESIPQEPAQPAVEGHPAAEELQTAVQPEPTAVPVPEAAGKPVTAPLKKPKTKAKKPVSKDQKTFAQRYWPFLALAAALVVMLMAAGAFLLSNYFPFSGTQTAQAELPQVTPSPQISTMESMLPGTWKRSGEDAAYNIFFTFAPDGRFVKTSPSLRETQGFGVYRVLENNELLLFFNGAAAESMPISMVDENTILLYGLRYTRSEEPVGAPLATEVAPGSAPINTQSLPMFDDFSNIYSGWSQETSPFASYGYVDGKYEISLLDKDLLFFPVLRDNSLNAQDVVLEIKAENTNAEETTAAGLMCRLNPSGNSFYTFEVSWDGGVFIGKYIDGTWTELARMTDHPAVQRGNLPNRLKAVCLGQTLELYVNGTLALQARDSALSSGALAFYARTAPEQLSADVLFDDFLAYQP